MAGRVEPVGDPGIFVGDDHPQDAVVVDRRLVPVEAALMGAVVDGLPPRIPERIAPVETLRGRDLHHERLVGRQLPRPDHRAVLRRRAHGRAVEGRQERVRRLRPGELEEEVQVGHDEVAQGDQLPGHHRPRVLAGARRPLTRAPIRSMDSDDATSVSQS